MGYMKPTKKEIISEIFKWCKNKNNFVFDNESVKEI